MIVKQKNEMANIVELYKGVKGTIEKRLLEFKQIYGMGNDQKMFMEFVFCLLTPQSKARVCWKAVECLKKEGFLYDGNAVDVLKCLQGVRFKYKKAHYIVFSRRLFLKDGIPFVKELLGKFSSPYEAREYLVKHVKGMGYKEASHFLRNIGFAENLAILDRHILKNLQKMGRIKGIPSSLSKKKYLEIERVFIETAKNLGIPPSHLDLLLWFKETGEVFK